MVHPGHSSDRRNPCRLLLSPDQEVNGHPASARESLGRATRGLGQATIGSEASEPQGTRPVAGIEQGPKGEALAALFRPGSDSPRPVMCSFRLARAGCYRWMGYGTLPPLECLAKPVDCAGLELRYSPYGEVCCISYAAFLERHCLGVPKKIVQIASHVS